jgi:hypothetical protein
MLAEPPYVPTIEKRLSVVFWTALRCDRCSRTTTFSVRGDGAGFGSGMSPSGAADATAVAYGFATRQAQETAPFLACQHCGALDPRGTAYDRRTRAWLALVALVSVACVLGGFAFAVWLAAPIAPVVYVMRRRPRRGLVDRVRLLDDAPAEHGVFR